MAWEFYKLGPNGDFKRTPTAHLVQCLLVVLELVNIGYHSLEFHLSTIKVCNSPRETESLGE